MNPNFFDLPFVEKEEASPEWAAKLAERSGEDIVNKVQQQKGIFAKHDSQF